MRKPQNKVGFKLELWQLYLLVAIIDSGLGSILALLAEIRDQFDFSVIEVSMIGGSGFVSAFVSQISLARFADRGYTRVLILGGVLVGGLSMVGLALSDSLFHFIGFRFLFGAGQGAVVPAIRRLIIVRNPERAGEALGRLGAFHIFGFVMGPALGSGLTSAFGLEASFLAFAAMILGCLPLVNRVAISGESQAPRPRIIRNLLKKRGIVAFLVAGFGYYGSFGIYEAIWAIFMSDRGASTLFIGFQLTLFAVPMMFMAPLGGRVAERVGGMTMSLVSLAILVPVLALYGLIESILFLTVLMLMQGFIEASIMPAMQLGISRLSGEDQASGQGLLNATGLIIAAVVALGSGAGYQLFGPVWLFLGWATVMALAILIAGLIGRDELQGEANRRASGGSQEETAV